jgi:bacteriorhodopsin
VRNTNSSSNSRSPQPSGVGLLRSIPLLLGRSLVWTGGQMQVLGADLIAQARGRPSWRWGFYAVGGAAAAVFIAVWAWDASASINMNRPNAPMRATAY